MRSGGAETDPDDEDFLFNLGYAYWLDHDAPARDVLIEPRIIDGDAISVPTLGSRGWNPRSREAQNR